MQEKTGLLIGSLKNGTPTIKNKPKICILEKIIWLIAPWTWEKIPKKVLKDNKVFCTIHHIDEDKLDSQSLKEFHERDKYVDLYHAISDKTLNQVKQLTNKKNYKDSFLDKSKHLV